MEKPDCVSKDVLSRLVLCGVLVLMTFPCLSLNASADSRVQPGAPSEIKGSDKVQIVVPRQPVINGGPELQHFSLIAVMA